MEIQALKASLMAARRVSTGGTFTSPPDSLVYVRHAEPEAEVGAMSAPLMVTVGEPLMPMSQASLSVNRLKLTSASTPSRPRARVICSLSPSSELHP